MSLQVLALATEVSTRSSLKKLNPPRAGLLFALLVCSGLFQGEALAHKIAYSDLRFDRISVDDGLSNGAVNTIIQDQQGFMWFGTEDGLNRYDGSRFVIFRPEPGNPNSLISGNFGAILQDSRGWLWLGTWGGGLDRLDPESGEFVHFGTGAEGSSGFRGINIEFVFEDSAGDIWIGTERSGLNRYRAEEASFEHFPFIAEGEPRSGSASIKAMEQSDNGRLFVGTDAGLFWFDGQSQRFETVQLPGEDDQQPARIRSLDSDRENGLWVGTRDDGLKHLDLETGIWTEYRHEPDSENSLSEDAIARVFVDSAGIVWVATYNSGLDRLDLEQGLFRNFDYASEESDETISFRRIDAIYEDRSGVLWFGTRGGGINKLPVRSRGFKSYRYAESGIHGLPHTTVRSVTEQPNTDGTTIWVGTDGAGLVRYTDSSDHFEHFPPRPGTPGYLQDGRVWSLLVDRENRLWAGTYSAGLFMRMLDAPGDEFRNFTHDETQPDSLGDDRVQVLHESINGSIWIGTANGLARFQSLDGKGRFERFRHSPGDPGSLSDNYVTALLDHEDGRLWVGTRTGLNLLDPRTGRAIRYVHDAADKNSISASYVTSLARDIDGRLWVGTDAGGLNLLQPGSQKFSVQSTLINETGLRISSILADPSGHLWIGTGRGLVRFDPTTTDIRAFGLSDGLSTLSFLRGAAVQVKSGEMFFGGLRGLVSFRPDLIHKYPHPPSLVFTSVSRLDTGEELLRAGIASEEAQLVLSHDAAFLRFEYAALDYLDASRNRYAHMMEGIDQGWIQTGNENATSYSGLRPGDYKFRVRAASSSGAWTEQGIQLALTIKPAFWQTWWFYSALALLIGALIYALHLARISIIRSQNLRLEHLNSRLLDQIQERNRIETEREALIMELRDRNAEMERFTYTVSHDLKSPLITIRGFLGLLHEDQETGRRESMRRHIDKIESAATRMNQLLDELLQFSRAGKVIDEPGMVPLGEIVADALGLARGEIENSGAEVILHGKFPLVFVDRVRMTEALQNLISNAARFMGDQLHPKIEIGVSQRGEQHVFYVRDNGIGIDRAHQAIIFELFERLDTGTEGTGIGLALVKRIIEKHDGQIWVESPGAGQGATFYFTLNLHGSTVSEDPSAAA